MDNILEQLLTLPNLVFCIAIYILVWGMRRVVKMVWPACEDNKFWRMLALPMSPVALGGLIAGLVSSYPFPEMFSALWSRVGLGMVLGLGSAHAYKMVKEMWKSKSGSTEEVLPESAPVPELPPVEEAPKARKRGRK